VRASRESRINNAENALLEMRCERLKKEAVLAGHGF